MFKLLQTKGIVLASSSPRRKAMLERYNLKFRIQTGNVEEKAKHLEQPEVFVVRTAKEKAESVFPSCQSEEIVISADTIVVFKNKILGKPRSPADSFSMLNRLNGNTHQVITSYVIYDCESKAVIQRSTKTEVSFFEYPDKVLKKYAESDEPADKAGAYSIQGIGTFLVKSIVGSYNNVVGLPIEILLNDLIDQKYIII